MLGRIKALMAGPTPPPPAPPPPPNNTFDYFVTAPAAAQNAVDLFKDEWVSRFPTDAPVRALPATAGLYDDERIRWTDQVLGPFRGRNVLELGPLEAGHTYMLEQLGASRVTAIEANARAFVKCLIAKEVFGLTRSRFLLGDFLGYLRATDERFDIIVACGVLYHMRDPVELIELLAGRTDKVMLWTHYYDAAALEKLPRKLPFSTQETATRAGFRHTRHRHEYGDKAGFASFFGGVSAFSSWMPRGDILSCLSHFGLREQAVAFDDPDHPNGPAFAVCASRAG